MQLAALLSSQGPSPSPLPRARIAGGREDCGIISQAALIVKLVAGPKCPAADGYAENMRIFNFTQ